MNWERGMNGHFLYAGGAAARAIAMSFKAIPLVACSAAATTSLATTLPAVMYDQALPLAARASARWLSHAPLQYAKFVRNYQVH